MYGPTTQCIIKTYYQMLQLSTCPYPPPESSLINRLINDRLLDAWPTVIQISPQLINISHRILIDPLLYHCRDSVIHVLKSGMLWSRRLPPGCVTRGAPPPHSLPSVTPPSLFSDSIVTSHLLWDHCRSLSVTRVGLPVWYARRGTRNRLRESMR